VDLQAHAKAISERYPLATPEQICAELCVSATEFWYAMRLQSAPDMQVVGVESADFFFDLKEPFLHCFLKLSEKHSKHKRNLLWGRINQISAVNMRKNPGLQAADVLAWCIGRSIVHGDYEAICSNVINALPTTFWRLGYDGLVNPYRKVWLPSSN